MAYLKPDISQPFSLNRNESVAEENTASGQKNKEEDKNDKSRPNSKNSKKKPNITPRG